MDRKQIDEIVIKAADNNKLSCSKAHELAKEHKISLKEVGAAADRLNIKLFACQLGCF
ncbi:hypothetical protein MFMK1_003379 [Metallumcola ferriviriculae]|uniref:Uncharacterized protein n=1 Tax=Metallumcola ferriviriculae TaxID=3039180 RepID=A0AAU0UQX1_9FIRM|nr:hypothetical protein MFMK1_003379 [Desulfitibacteraceae bacterium MK1]